MPGSLRVATYNLYLGADLSLLFDAADLDELAERVRTVRGQLDATRFEERAGAVATVLARERPDVVGLQEVSRWASAVTDTDRTSTPEQVLVDFLPTLVAALEGLGCPYDVHAVNENFGGAMPVGAEEWVQLVGANVTLVRRGAGVRVVAEECASYATSHTVVTGIDGVTFPIVRSWGLLDVLVDGQPVRFVNTHTEAYDDRVRDAQRDEIVARTADVDAPVVLVGDFNATPDAVGMTWPWVDAWSRGEGPGATCGQAPDLANEDNALADRIDYVWVRGLDVGSARVVGDRLEDKSSPHRLWPSDHAGVVADLALP